jgi:4-amino-4-deoxy-L-arabinose transferase-like glycosyltransferase
MFRHRALREGIVLAAFCGFLFFFGLSWFGLVGADEPRYAQVAREMWARHDWITPVLGGVPWLEKPPLYYWQAMMAYSLFGVSDWAARIPSAVDATLLVVAVFLFLRRFRPDFQLDGALIAASSVAMVGFGRAASTDMPLASMFAIAMLDWYAWEETSNKLWLAGFYVFAGLGVLAKGPIAVFLAVVVIAVFAACKRDWRLIARTVWFPGILLFCVVTLPWYVLVQLRNPEFFRIFILQHNLERFGSNLYHHPQPFWFYLPIALLSLLPWTALIVDAAIRRTQNLWRERREIPRQDALGLFLLIWLIVPILFFSISQSKLPGYILPALPAGSLLLAESLPAFEVRTWARRFVIVLHSFLAAGLIVPSILILHIMLRHRVPLSSGTAILLAIAGGLAGLSTFVLIRYGAPALRFATLLPVIIAVSAVLRLGAPALDDSLSARPVAQQLVQWQSATMPVAVFHVRRELDYGLQFYLDRNILRYEDGQVPESGHILIASHDIKLEIAKNPIGRRALYLGSFSSQRLDFYLVSAK